MAKGQHLTKYQQGIVNRYYEHKDTIGVQRLGELVSELYLCDSPAKADKLWKQAEVALAKVSADKATITKILAARKPELLAELLKKL
ncbi:MAG: hypothetical protein J0L61_11290 [Planctomycetes bacterium]|nr:hypothetical protein [Planctomycetota bacterium]